MTTFLTRLPRAALLVALLLTALAARAQGPAWSGLAYGPIGGLGQVQGVATDASGNVVVVGYFQGAVAFGSTVLTSAGSRDWFVAKWLPASGTWAWAAAAGGTADDRAQGVAVSGTSVYVTGFITNNPGDSQAVRFADSGGGPGTDTQYGAGSARDLALAKYTDNGTSATFVWSQVGGGTLDDQGNGVAVSGSNVYVAGSFVNSNDNDNSVAFGGSGSTAGTARQDGIGPNYARALLLAKYTDNGATGTFRWSHAAGGSGGGEAVGVAVSGTSVYMAGHCVNTSNDANGVRFGGTGTTAGTSVQKGANANAANDLVLAKYVDNGNTGTFRWSHVAGGSEDDFAGGVAVQGSSVYLAGTAYNSNAAGNERDLVFGGSGNTPGTNNQYGASSIGSRDIVLAKYTDNGTTGTFGWSHVAGGRDTDYATGVAATSSGVYVAGYCLNSSADANSVRFGGSGTTAGTTPLAGASASTSNDLVLAKYTDGGATGTLAWALAGGGTGNDQGLGLAVGSSGVVAGGFVSASPVFTFGTLPDAALDGTIVLNSSTSTASNRPVLALAAETGSWQALAAGATGGTSTTNAVVADASGNLLVAGFFTGQVLFGSTLLASAGSTDAFVAKYLPATGTWAWAARAGGTGDDVATSVAVGDGGKVYVAGYLFNSNDAANAAQVFFGNSGAAGTSPQLGASSNGSQDWFVARYTDNGNSATFGWSQVAGGTSGDRANGVAVSGTSVYVVGSVYNTRTNDNAVLFGGSGTTAGTGQQYGASASNFTPDLVLAKYQDNGSSATFRWSQVGGGSGFDTGTGVAVSGGSVYVSGYISNNTANDSVVRFGGSGTTTGPSPQLGATSVNNNDLLLAKYTDNGATGSFSWSQVGGGTSVDQGAAVAVSGTSVYLAGTLYNSTSNIGGVVFGGSGTTVGAAPQYGVSGSGTNDLVLAKYTDNGASATFRWSQVGGSGSTDQAFGVAASGTSVYMVGYQRGAATFGGSGTTLGTSPQPMAGSGSNADLVVAKYQDNGNSSAFAWSQAAGGANTDQAYGVAVSGTSVYVAGTATPPASFGSFGLPTLAGATVSVLARLPDALPLPVQLVAFTAQPAGPAAVRLTWATASELNSAAFEVQRSADGLTWQTLGRVAAAGNSTSRRPYAFRDEAALPGRSYYRLRQLDLDGTAATSPVQVVTLGAGGLNVYPNPAPHGAASLTDAAPGQPVQVLDALGRVAATATTDADGTARLGGLAPGLYLVRCGAASGRLLVE